MLRTLVAVALACVVLTCATGPTLPPLPPPPGPNVNDWPMAQHADGGGQ